MAVTVIGLDYDNHDGMASSLEATFKANRENGNILMNLADAAAARAEGRKDGPKKADPRPVYRHQAFPTFRHHADGRAVVCETHAHVLALEEQGFRAAPYPKVRVAPGDPAAEKAARIAQDLETAGKIASQNDLILKLTEQVEALAKAAGEPEKRKR